MQGHSTDVKAQDELFTKQILVESREQFILKMYNLSQFKALNDARYFKYKQKCLKVKFDSISF